MKIVKNDCFGGFGLSVKGKLRLGELRGTPFYIFTNAPGTFTGSPTPWDGVTEPPLGLYYYCTAKEWDESLAVYDSDIPRDDHCLVQVVEELGDEANNRFAKLIVVEVPDNIEWYVDEYDGAETIRENHREW